MPSDKAIETAKVAAIAEASRKDPYRVLRVDTDILEAAITAAYAIDGDFNDGVEAAAKYLEGNYDLARAAKIRKLKR